MGGKENIINIIVIFNFTYHNVKASVTFIDIVEGKDGNTDYKY